MTGILSLLFEESSGHPEATPWGAATRRRFLCLAMMFRLSTTQRGAGPPHSRGLISGSGFNCYKFFRMATPVESRDNAIRVLTWIFPITYLIHIVEELWGGEGYPAYIHRLRGVQL